MGENGTHILLVEDEYIIAMATQQSLEKNGYTVYHAGNGKKAVDTVSAGEVPVDLILMDIDLGSGIDGTQAAQEILDIRDIPIVFLSSHTEPEIVEKTEKITSYGYIMKNSGIFVLTASIRMAQKLFNANRGRSQTEGELHELNKTLETSNKKLAESEDRFKALSLLSEEGIMIHEQGTVVDANQKFLDMIGLQSLDEIVGKKGMEVIPFTPESRKRIIESMKKGREDFYDIEIIRPDGTTAPFETGGHAIHYRGTPARIVFMRDITERKKVEKALENQNRRLDYILQGTNVGTWEWNVQTGETIFNERWADIIGYTLEEISPVSIDTWIKYCHPDDLEESDRLLKSCFDKTSEYYHFECRMKHKNGQWVWVLDRGKVATWTEDGKPEWMFGTHQDITPRKQAEEEIQKQLSEKELLMKEVHHRVKNNIANIEAFLSLQVNSYKDPKITEALQDAVSRVRSMYVLYDRLLLESDFQDVSVKEYTESLIASILPLFTDTRAIKINKNIEDFTLPAKTATSVGIILNELLTNACKYAFKDRDPGTITITLENNNSTVTLSVQDNGIGLNSSTQSDDCGGFGLTIIKMLTEQLEGAFSISSDNGTKAVLQFNF